MKKIVKVIPNEKFFSVNWMIGKRCNYDCMYCPAEYHDATSNHHSLKVLQRAWNKIFEKTKHLELPYKISFTGGEPSANKNFLPLVKWLKTKFNIHSITVTSNGSAGLSYYEKLCGFVSSLSLSTHSEFMDEKMFFQKTTKLNKLMKRPKKSLHVNIMNEFWNQDRIKLYEQFCIKNNLSYSINEIDYSKKIREQIKKEGKANLNG